MENRSENTSPCVLHYIFYLAFQNFRKCKTCGRVKFYATECYSTRPRYLLDKIKINYFKMDYVQKTAVMMRDKLQLTRSHIYLIFF